MPRRGFLWAALLCVASTLEAAPAAAEAQRILDPGPFAERLFVTRAAAEAPPSPPPPPPPGGGTACPVPAVDTCTDFALEGIQWAGGRMTWEFNPLLAPTGALESLQAAAAAWETEFTTDAVAAVHGGDGSDAQLSFGGLTIDGLAGHRFDSRSIVSFPLTWNNPASALAVTTCTYFVATGDIVECDIEFNRDVDWGGLLSPGGTIAYDVQNAATHEFGHVLGLGHVPAPGAAALTMAPTAAAGETLKRSLGAGDILGVRALYPA